MKAERARMFEMVEDGAIDRVLRQVFWGDRGGRRQPERDGGAVLVDLGAFRARAADRR